MEALLTQPIDGLQNPGRQSGITLLEAYSALAKNARAINTAIDVPTAGLLPTGDSDTDFWHVSLQKYS